MSLLRNLEKFVQASTVNGIFAALLNLLPIGAEKEGIPKQILMRFRYLSEAGKPTFVFLIAPNNFEKGSLNSNFIQVLRALSSYLPYCHGSTLYGDPIQEQYLPPLCADPALLDCKFIKSTSQNDIEFLEKLDSRQTVQFIPMISTFIPAYWQTKRTRMNQYPSAKSPLNYLPKLQEHPKRAD